MKWLDRRQADKVEICFRASKADKKRIGAVVTRTHPSVGDEKREGGGRCGGIRDPTRLDGHAPRSRYDHPPLLQSVRMEGHYAAGSDTSVTVTRKLRKERVLAVCPTLEEDMRRLTLGSARGVGIADSSRALEVVGCYGAC